MKKFIKTLIMFTLVLVFPTLAFASENSDTQFQEPLIGCLQTVIDTESPGFMALQTVKGIPDTLTAEFISNGDPVAIIRGNRILQVKPCYVDGKQNITIRLFGAGLPSKANFKFSPVANEICGELFVNIIPKDSNISGEMGVSVIPDNSSINGQFSITIK